jgi:hypothetical protein
MSLAYRVCGNFPQGSLVRSSNDAHDVNKLILVILAPEERNSGHHFGEDATAGPNVNRRTVCTRPKKYVWSSVPERYNLVAQGC